MNLKVRIANAIVANIVLFSIVFIVCSIGSVAKLSLESLNILEWHEGVRGSLMLFWWVFTLGGFLHETL